MSSVFRIDDRFGEKPKRNTFDMSFANNLSLNFGRLYPVYVQPVSSGDSIKIEPKFALRFLPQVFPVQTRQRASLKFYYVRNRNLWRDFPDFIGKTKQNLVPPYISFDSPFYLRPCGLADYMGLPVKVYPVVGNEDITVNIYKLRFPWVKSNGKGDYVYVPNSALGNYLNVKDDWFSIRVIRI